MSEHFSCNIPIKLDNVSLSINDKFLISNLSFEVHQGSVTALLGHNGAGKSTTIKSIIGLLDYEGKIEIFGIDVKKNPKETNRLISYLGESNPLYDEMYVNEYFQFICKIHEVEASQVADRIKKVVVGCGLSSVQTKKIRELSKGYRQRVGIAKSIIRDSQIIILDEPTNALDRVNIDEIRQLIKFLSLSKTILISTHHAEEIERLCTDAIVLKDGKMINRVNIDSIKNNISQDSVFCEINGAIPNDFFSGICELDSVELLAQNRYKIKQVNSKDVMLKLAEHGLSQNILITELYAERKQFSDIIKELIIG